MAERRVGPREQRRLEREGFRLEITPGGKRYWREPETGRRLSPNHAAEMLEQKEVRTLEEAGWEPVEVKGKTYWCRPDSGHLYPRGAAYDVLRTMGGRRMRREHHQSARPQSSFELVLTSIIKANERSAMWK